MTDELPMGDFSQGDTVTRNVSIYAAPGAATPAVLAAPTGVYIIAASQFSSSAYLVKTGVLTQEVSTGLWTMTISLTKTETAGLPAGTLYEQVSIQDTDGSNDTVYRGGLVVTPALPLTIGV